MNCGIADVASSELNLDLWSFLILTAYFNGVEYVLVPSEQKPKPDINLSVTVIDPRLPQCSPCILQSDRPRPAMISFFFLNGRVTRE